MHGQEAARTLGRQERLCTEARKAKAGVPDPGWARRQVDEPALREGLPLKRARWESYLTWAVRAFRLSTVVAAPGTQIVTHLCYSEFADILHVRCRPSWTIVAQVPDLHAVFACAKRDGVHQCRCSVTGSFQEERRLSVSASEGACGAAWAHASHQSSGRAACLAPQQRRARAQAIDGLDADVLTIENSRSGDEMLRALAKYGYARDIGAGVYDVHSPVVPTCAALPPPPAGHVLQPTRASLGACRAWSLLHTSLPAWHAARLSACKQ